MAKGSTDPQDARIIAEITEAAKSSHGSSKTALGAIEILTKYDEYILKNQLSAI